MSSRCSRVEGFPAIKHTVENGMTPEDIKGIPTGDGSWLKRVCKELGNQHDPAPPAMNPWYQSAVKEIDWLEAKVYRLQNMGENDGKVIGTLNEEIASLKEHVRIAKEREGIAFTDQDSLRGYCDEQDEVIAKLKAEVEQFRETIASQGKELTQWAVEGETLRSKLTEKKRECLTLRGDLLQKEAEFRQLLDISEALAKR